MRLVLLSRVERVIDLDAVADGDQVAFVGVPPISDAQQRDLVAAGVNGAHGIPLKLFAMLERAHQAIAVISL